MDDNIDKQLERKIINYFIPMTQLFDRLGIEYSEHSNMFCPFHDNTETPAAHYHSDSNLLWCYSEQKMYGSWNLIKIYFPNMDTNKIAVGIIKKFGIDEVERVLGSVEIDDSIPFDKSLKLFRDGKITYKELCSDISECYL